MKKKREKWKKKKKKRKKRKDKGKKQVGEVSQIEQRKKNDKRKRWESESMLSNSSTSAPHVEKNMSYLTVEEGDYTITQSTAPRQGFKKHPHKNQNRTSLIFSNLCRLCANDDSG